LRLLKRESLDGESAADRRLHDAAGRKISMSSLRGPKVASRRSMNGALVARRLLRMKPSAFRRRQAPHRWLSALRTVAPVSDIYHRKQVETADHQQAAGASRRGLRVRVTVG